MAGYQTVARVYSCSSGLSITKPSLQIVKPTIAAGTANPHANTLRREEHLSSRDHHNLSLYLQSKDFSIVQRQTCISRTRQAKIWAKLSSFLWSRIRVEPISVIWDKFIGMLLQIGLMGSCCWWVFSDRDFNCILWNRRASTKGIWGFYQEITRLNELLMLLNTVSGDLWQSVGKYHGSAVRFRDEALDIHWLCLISCETKSCAGG